MSPKKQKAPAAQQLIDSLLDESTPAPRFDAGDADSVRLSLEDDSDRARRTSTPVAQPTHSKHDERFDSITATASGGQRSVTPQLESVSTLGASLGASPGAPTESQEIEKTVRIDSRQARVKPPESSDFTQPNPTAANEPSQIDRQGITELKTVVKMRDRHQEKPADFNRGQKPVQSESGGPSFSSAEAALKRSEILKITDARIAELEQELERVRRENEQLATAGETLRRRTDELISKSENLEINLRESQRIHEEEKEVIRGQLQARDREITDLRNRVEEKEAQLESNFKKIRVRERDLGHKLEIMKMESQTLISAKDKMILDLKRQIDQLSHENEYGKQKTQELFNQFKDKQETVRRVVRALRIALTILEGDEDAKGGIKKAE